MRPNLPIVSLVGTSGGKVLGSLSRLEMNYCSSSGFIASFGLGTGIVDGARGNQTDMCVGTLMAVKSISLSSLGIYLMSMFLERGIHPSMPICIVKIVDENRVGDICFRNIYFVINETKTTVIELLRM